jgi:uncharacterized Zn-binding protein involved in type VI secretion
MNRRLLWITLAALSLVAVVAAHAKDAKPAPAATLGKPGAKWSSTTLEAATADANKKVLATGKPAAVTGEVVDVSCYLQMGKRGEGHVACGTKCITNGQPIGLVDANDNLYLLFAEEHHPRRDGQVTLKDAFLPLLAKQVTVNGMVTNLHGGARALFVEASELSSMAKPEEGQK